jgi:GT2 family glycosyltransferase
MFSILIPTYKNFEYLKICINSLKKNSKYNNQILVHINTEHLETENFLIKNKISYTKSEFNSGMPKSLNTVSKLSTKNFIVISHDDFYYCPDWDEYLMSEIKKCKNSFFLYTGLMIGPNQPLNCNFGENFNNFDETSLLNKYNDLTHYDFTGSTKHPAILKKELWERVGGWSEEFYPTGGDDTDFLVKLWNVGVRDFKGVNKSRVYHFGSITTRKKKDSKNNYLGSKANYIFLKKWGFSINFFEKFYLRSGYNKKGIVMKKYDGLTKEPEKNIYFFFNLLLCKIKLIIAYIK